MFNYLSPEYFNVIEGSFWVVLGAVCLVIYFKVSKIYSTLALFSAITLLTFGLSDFFEVAYGSFLVSGMEWLLMWKIVNVIGLCAIFVWYLALRLKQ